MISNKDIGYRCKCFRRAKGYTLEDVGNATGYSKFNVFHFENGNNDNMRILLWYLSEGMSTDFLTGEVFENGANV